MARSAVAVVLSDEERAFLETQTRRRNVLRSQSDRSRMILLCAEGLTNKEAARRMGLDERTVGKWRRRFVRFRLEGLKDEHRSGRPRTMSDDQTAEVVRLTTETKPADATHWSLRSMAARVGLSYSSIRRIWSSHELQPHRSETFKLSTDPEFVEKVRDITGLYLSPPDNAIVLCMDEKSRMQALGRDQPILPVARGVPERRTHTYRRNGTVTLFAALNVATGEVIGKFHKRHRAEEFPDFLNLLEAEMPEGPDVHIVMDNLSTHKTQEVKDWFAERPHWHAHFTPTSASWINLVERLFSDLACKRLKRGEHNSVEELKAAVMDFIETRNRNPKRYVWRKSADKILKSVKRFCLKTQQYRETYEKGYRKAYGATCEAVCKAVSGCEAEAAA